MNKNTLTVIIIIVLLFGNAYFALNCFTPDQELIHAPIIRENQQEFESNKHALEFLSFFTEEVLMSEEGISFETRLFLEHKAREADDREILDAWNTFLSSKTEEEAQRNTADLIHILVAKISN